MAAANANGVRLDLDASAVGFEHLVRNATPHVPPNAQAAVAKRALTSMSGYAL